MSRSLSIECEWIDQPLAADPLERRTWARLTVAAAGRSVTRLWDRDAQSERTSLYIPAFPLASWIVVNWWALLYEPVPPGTSEKFLSSHTKSTPDRREWLHRHCLRAAESGLLLPHACFFSDGRNHVIDWSADDQDAYAHMPGYFIEEGRVFLDTGEVRRALWEFVADVLSRVEGISDPRVAGLKQNWDAIVQAGQGEEAFCRAAGRMGLDPYETSTWDPAFLSLLEGLGDDLDQPLVIDFLEATNQANATPLWHWIDRTRTAFDLRKPTLLTPIFSPIAGTPSEIGYQLAMKVRQAMSGRSRGPLDRVAKAAPAAGIKPLLVEERNHLSSASVKATVGWSGGRDPIVAGPRQSRQDNARFLEARALFHAAFACQSGPRLITESRTWDQQASRAFAAELLAPIDELSARYDDSEGLQDAEQFVADLAAEYGVSSKVIRHQFENVGISLDAA